MSGKLASRICGVAGIVSFVCQIVAAFTGDKATEYEINKILDEREKKNEEEDWG